ncbi:MAG TPA: alanine dehydrogenase [bacterium]
MHIGIPTEIKDHEYRVGLTPGAVARLTAAGHRVMLQQGAGVGSGFPDREYAAAGAVIVPDAATVYGSAELICKVKEPQPPEVAHLRRDQLLFSYLHLAADPALARALLHRGTTCLDFATLQEADGSLPTLAPMSRIAGRLATLVGAYHLRRPAGGRGVLLPGLDPGSEGRVTILGGGNVGREAAEIAARLGATTRLLETSTARRAVLASHFAGRVAVMESTPAILDGLLPVTDLLIGAVLVPGARAPVVVTRRQVAALPQRAVLVDVAIDQGGCAATSRPTTHGQPTYVEEEVLHYCVTNMPSAASHTATVALTAAILPYLMTLAAQGADAALRPDTPLGHALNLYAGQVIHPAVAASLQ